MFFKNRFDKPILLAVIGLILIALFATRARDQQRRIYYYAERNIVGFLNIHKEPTMHLVVDHVDYGGVCGAPPYHVRVRPINSVLFFTQTNNVDFTAHVYDLDARRDLEIHCGDLLFAWLLSLPSIISADKDEIILKDQSVGTTAWYRINLKERTIREAPGLNSHRASAKPEI